MCSRAISVIPSGFCLSPRFARIWQFWTWKCCLSTFCVVSCIASPILSVWPRKICTVSDLNDRKIFSLLWLSTPRLIISLYAHVYLHQSDHQPSSPANQVPEKRPIRKIIPLRRNSEYGVPNVCLISLEQILAIPECSPFCNSVSSDSNSLSVHFTAMLVFPVHTLSYLTDNMSLLMSFISVVCSEMEKTLFSFSFLRN